MPDTLLVVILSWSSIIVHYRQIFDKLPRQLFLILKHSHVVLDKRPGRYHVFLERLQIWRFVFLLERKVSCTLFDGRLRFRLKLDLRELNIYDLRYNNIPYLCISKSRSLRNRPREISRISGRRASSSSTTLDSTSASSSPQAGHYFSSKFLSVMIPKSNSF